jgi:hypothetical protein
MFFMICNSEFSSMTLSLGCSVATLLKTGDRIVSHDGRSPASTHGSLLVLFVQVTDTETHSLAEPNLTRSTSTKPKKHNSIGEDTSASSQDKKPCAMGSGHDLHVLVHF